MFISGFEMASSDWGERWKLLISKARDLYDKRNYKACLAAYREASAIRQTDKLTRRIKQIEVSKC